MAEVENYSKTHVSSSRLHYKSDTISWISQGDKLH